MIKRIFLPKNTIIIVPNEGEIKTEPKTLKQEEKKVMIKSIFKYLPDVEISVYDDSEPLHFIDHPDRSNEIEPRYIPIDQQQRKEEVEWLIKCLRAVDDSKTQNVIKRIIDKLI